MSHNPTRKKAMIEALEKCMGIVTTASKIAGINRETHYRWLNTDPKYKEKVESIDDIVLDFAESQLHQQIKDKDTAATIFFLKTKGKKRGYIEKSEIGITDNKGNDVRPILQLLPSQNCDPINSED